AGAAGRLRGRAGQAGPGRLPHRPAAQAAAQRPRRRRPAEEPAGDVPDGDPGRDEAGQAGRLVPEDLPRGRRPACRPDLVAADQVQQRAGVVRGRHQGLLVPARPAPILVADQACLGAARPPRQGLACAQPPLPGRPAATHLERGVAGDLREGAAAAVTAVPGKVAGRDDAGLVEPGRGGGLGEVFRRRYLLRLIVRRELRARYQGSLLGLGWSYVRPAAHFAVFFFVAGVFLGMSDRVEHFPIFMFSVLGNAPLVRKVYLPRELFPVASLLVSCVHLLPGLAIVLAAAVAWGWTPSFAALGSALLGFALVATLGLGLGLICSALHVFY